MASCFWRDGWCVLSKFAEERERLQCIKIRSSQAAERSVNRSGRLRTEAIKIVMEIFTFPSSKTKHRAQAYSRALRLVRGVVQKDPVKRQHGCLSTLLGIPQIKVLRAALSLTGSQCIVPGIVFQKHENYHMFCLGRISQDYFNSLIILRRDKVEAGCGSVSSGEIVCSSYRRLHKKERDIP